MIKTYIIATVFATIASIISYYVLKPTSLEFIFEISFICLSVDAFNLLKDPRLLPKIDYSVKNVTIQKREIEDSEEKVHFASSELIEHVGLMDATSVLTADEDFLTVSITTYSLYGMMRRKVKYTIMESLHDMGEIAATKIVEECHVKIPWILASFMNRTISSYHPIILENVKFILGKTGSFES